MRGLFWVLLIAGLAVAVTVGARYNTGYVLFVLHPYRVEMSLNFLAALLVLLFVAGYVVVRVVAHTLRLPSQVSAFRQRRRAAKAQRNLVGAVRAFLEGRYAKAEKAANAAIDLHQNTGIAAVIAARAAHELRAYDRRDRYLARSTHYADADLMIRSIAQADLSLQERDFKAARSALDRLPRKHTAALRLDLRAAQQGRHWDRYLEVLGQLEKLNALEPVRIAELRRYALCENLARKAGDPAALRDYWQRLPQRERLDAKVAAEAARRLVASGEPREAQPIIEASLEREWDSDLVLLYAECAAEDALRRIERAERWLKNHPSDAALLLTLGRLCAKQRLWGKARSYLEASLSVEESFGATIALAKLLDEVGEPEAAQRAFRRGLELAEPLVQRPPVRSVSGPDMPLGRLPAPPTSPV
jgi:HemY protein